jgi:predicted TIM-barrel fold metal-dependent hydrolase
MARPQVTLVEHPAAPVIDVHNHLGRWLSADGSWLVVDVAELLRTMDRLAIETIVNLDGRWGIELDANLDRYDRAHPGRFLTFCHLDWAALGDRTAAEQLVAQTERAAAAGARGVKIWKDLGLEVVDGGGRLVAPDDERIVPAVQRAGELGLPVLIHTADPLAFFEPLDHTNERIEELHAHPQWWFGRAGLPSFAELLDGFERLVAACPGTTFIGAHVGGVAEDLDRVAQMLDRHANLVVDLGGRMAELGRQPRAARRLILAHPDRVVFGSDAYPPSEADYLVWFRFLETDDECFDYAPGEDVPPQGRWKVAALDLPTAVLPRLYASNARRILGATA